MNSQIIKEVLRREGGAKLTKDPDDPGGVTKYGISKRSNPDVDVENLTEDEAVIIYLEKYWRPSKASSLPEPLQDMYFDMVVNFGQRRAVKILQEACNHKNKGKDLVVDGRIGPNTLRASKSLEKDRLLAFRIFHYARICMKNKTLMKYYYGWVRRTIEI
jgi:lysozyme family protein|tara:strand:+ start:445 stop:924 length:480 start_codon:yes stop_codon:yes gene_type:complete